MDIQKQNEMMVYKSKEINEAVCRLSNDAYKLVLLYISMIRPEADDPEGEKCIYLKDYCNITEQNEYTIGDKIHDLCYEIAENPLSFRKANGDFLITNWFSSADWVEDEKKIVLTSHKKVRPFLFDLKKKLESIYGEGSETVEMEQNLSGQYLSYPYGRVGTLKKKYSIRFYEILRPTIRPPERKTGTIKIDLPVLRQAIGAFKGRLEYNKKGELKAEPKYTYPLFGGFNKSVLTPCLEEVSQKTDIIVSYDILKKGKKVTAIKFFIKNNEEAPSFAQQGVLFMDDDTCPPPAADPDLEIFEDDSDSISLDDVLSDGGDPAAEEVEEIPEDVIAKVPAKQWATTKGCKKVCHEILAKEGLEAAVFYIYLVLRKKPDADSYGKWIRFAWKELDEYNEYLKRKEAIEKERAEKARIEYEQFVEMYRTADDESLKEAYKAKQPAAIQVWEDEGRGKEIEEREAEFARLDAKIKEVDADPDQTKLFNKYMVSRCSELNDQQAMRLKTAIRKGDNVALFTKRYFIKDFLSSIKTSKQTQWEPVEGEVEYIIEQGKNMPKQDFTVSDEDAAEIDKLLQEVAAKVKSKK